MSTKIRVNGTKFILYELDNIETVKKRIASMLDTTVDYLYFPDIPDLNLYDFKQNLTVENLLDDIKKSAKNNSSIVQLIDELTKKQPRKYSIQNNVRNVIKIWMAYNTHLTKEKALDKISKLVVDQKYFKTETDFQRECKDKKEIIKDLKTDINNTITSSEYKLVLFREFGAVEESILFTEFELEYAIFELNLRLQNISFEELFNDIVLNNSVPFATVKSFYKILKDFIPPDEWAVSYTSLDPKIKHRYRTRKQDQIDKELNESLVLKVSQKEILSVTKLNYADTVIKIDAEGFVKANITINTEKGNVSQNEYIKRMLSVFNNIKIKHDDPNEKKIVGLFYYPAQRLDKYVFSDLVMNDDLFSMLIKIDESEKITKKKSGLKIHFNHVKTGHISATITEKKKIKTTITKSEEILALPVGEPYIRVRISQSTNTQAVNIFREILGKLFVLYDSKYNDIVEIYKEYIPDFGNIEIEEEIITPLQPEDVAPDLFIKTYSRVNCAKMPTPITEEEYNKSIEEGKSVMKFPRDIPKDKNAEKFPRDGINQNYYKCDHETHPNIGLTENELKNADIYPYVPCCFIASQKNKQLYKRYNNPSSKKIEKEIKEKKSDIIKTDKILKNNQYGSLPQNIETLFTLIDPEPKYEYIRRGVNRTEHSFLNCVMEALNEETNILDISDDKELLTILVNKRKEFATKEFAPLCRQELYDMDTSKIMKMIRDKNVYLDPKLFVHLLEDYYKCNIYIFTKKYLGGEMILPRHTQSYYKNKNTFKSIYIFEHMGSESDHAKYPQCELIIKYNNLTGKTVNDSFSYKDSKNIRHVYENLRKSYALNKPIEECDLGPLLGTTKILSQSIDSYGKTRQINIQFLEHKVTLITSPIQPIRTPEMKTSAIYFIDLDTAIKLASVLGIVINHKITVGKYIKEISGILGNVNISIPIQKTKDTLVYDIPLGQEGLNFPIDGNSALVKYNKNKKLARYLVEYVFWMYSNFLHNQDIVEITDDNISRFSNEAFEIIPDFDYEYVSKYFSHTFLIDGKIVVQSQEIIKRLVYVLRLMARRNSNGLLNYYSHTVIHNYYEDVTDFDQHPNQVILYGEESVDKWIEENNMMNGSILHNEILIAQTTPYFFKNNLINENVYLAQNTNSYEKANTIGVEWINKGYNINIYVPKTDNERIIFPIYSYTNEYDIKFMTGSSDTGVILIGYKIDNKPFYTVLLPLN